MHHFWEIDSNLNMKRISWSIVVMGTGLYCLKEVGKFVCILFQTEPLMASRGRVSMGYIKAKGVDSTRERTDSAEDGVVSARRGLSKEPLILGRNE